MILNRGILHDKEISVHNSCWIGFWAACSVVGCSPIHGNFTKCDQYKPLCLIHMLFHVFWSICVKYLFSWREYLCMPFFGHQRFCVEVLCVASFPLFFKKQCYCFFENVWSSAFAVRIRMTIFVLDPSQFLANPFHETKGIWNSFPCVQSRE